MVQTQQLVEFLKELSHDSAHILDKIVSDPANSEIKNVPVFENGHLVKVVPTSLVDYLKVKRRICYDEKIVGSTAFQNALNEVDQIIKNMVASRSVGKNTKTSELAKTEVCNFLTQYARERYEGRSGPFSRSVKQFRAHIVSELPFFTYITPLYNVRGEFSEIILSKETKIRTIANDEYLRIVDTSKPLKEISYHQSRLKFVIECRIDAKLKQPLDVAKEEYAFVTNLIRLTCSGEPEFGQIYLLNTSQLNITDIRIAEYRESTPQSPGFVTLESNDSALIIKRYKDMMIKFGRGKRSRFLANAIARFGMACRHTNYSNKIVDYVISLESLLIESSGESTLKLAHRVSALCAENDKERLAVWEFIKSVYKFRSGIVHKSSESPFIINSKILGTDEVTHRLHELTSKAILRMNGVMTTMESKDDILGVLDRSIYDKSLLLKLQKHWK